MKKISCTLAALFLLTALTFAQTAPTDSAKIKSTNAPSGEQRAAKRLDAVRKDPQLLRGFLRAFPKGGDLHMHLSGAIYAESYIAWAAEMNLCVDAKTFTIVAANKDWQPPAPGTTPAADAPKQCADPAAQRPAAEALRDSVLYRNLIDALSMRNFNPAVKAAEYQFFDAFGKFGAVSFQRTGDMLAEVARRAAAQNEHYLEVIITLDGGWGARAADAAGTISGNDFDAYRIKLLANGLENALPAGKKSLDAAETQMRKTLRCGQKDADPGCDVTIRYIFQVARANSRERVFAQTLAGFLMVAGGSPQSDERVVGLNYVQPEDALVAVRDFNTQMEALDWLHQQYPGVRVSLHAGELVFGLVDPKELGWHVRKSVEQGHALRIGHGVDVMNDADAAGLLKEMAAKHIAVEICLSSNDQILGVRGKYHPFLHYLRAGVPLAIATDDEGVARSDITHEYQRAVEDFGISYAELKKISRNSLEYSFLAGAGLWDGKAGVPRKECADLHSASCAQFIKGIGLDKATAEYQLELRFQEFEKK